MSDNEESFQDYIERQVTEAEVSMKYAESLIAKGEQLKKEAKKKAEDIGSLISKMEQIATKIGELKK